MVPLGKVGLIFLSHVRAEDRLWGRVCLAASCCRHPQGTRHPARLQGWSPGPALSRRAE